MCSLHLVLMCALAEQVRICECVHERVHVCVCGCVCVGDPRTCLGKVTHAGEEMIYICIDRYIGIIIDTSVCVCVCVYVSVCMRIYESTYIDTHQTPISSHHFIMIHLPAHPWSTPSARKRARHFRQKPLSFRKRSLYP